MGKRKKPKPAPETYDSDDERTYTKEAVPDAEDDEYYHDEVDQFHMQRDQILLEDAETEEKDVPDSDQEEVLAFDDDTSSDEDETIVAMEKRLKVFRSRGIHEEMVHSESEEEEAPRKKHSQEDRDRAWGSSKKAFYGGLDSDFDESESGSEPEASQLEEQEALAIQKRLLQGMDDDDIGLHLFKPVTTEAVDSSEKITQDLSKMSRREKLQLVKKQSPELLQLIDDYKIRVEELQTRLLPVYKLIKERKIPADTTGAQLVTSKVEIYLNYLINFSFYLCLKAKQTPVEHHPVIKRLLQYRNIMKQTDDLETRFKPELDALLQRIEDGEEFSPVEESNDEQPVEQSLPKFESKLAKKKKKKSHEFEGRPLSELLQDELIQGSDISKGGRSWGRKRSRLEPEMEQTPAAQGDVPAGGDLELGPDGGDTEADPGGDPERRGINYQIAKNKGLHTKKRKELRNPRVKHRVKYRKAKINRRGQVREVRPELTRYGGEMSGIRAGIKKSIKLK